ncbi:MAG: hypothetical protein VKL39_23505, partial [Leptolyngbyaceae bacterium]|nr:hypothetical protein [Leptolyngbyaceae bacterium]
MINQIPRRPPRIQPPLRRRSAACSSSGQVMQCAPPVVKPKPPIGGSFPISQPQRSEYEDVPPELKKLFK